MLQDQQKLVSNFADFLLEHRDEIIEKWLNAVQQERHSDGAALLTRNQLVDHMPQLLDELVNQFQQRIEEIKLQEAQAHGAIRREQGYRVDELAQELGLFRIVLLDFISVFIRQYATLPDKAHIGMRRQLHQFLNTAAITSIRKFAEDQFYEAQSYRTRLEESNRRISLLLESTSEGILGMDVSGNCTFINRAGASQLGYEPAQLAGKNIHTIVHNRKVDGTDYPAAECPVLISIKEKRNLRFSNDVFWRRDGSSFPVEYNASPIMEGDRLVGAVVTFCDITERKQLETERIRKTEEAERANRVKDDFIAFISHELRNPLSAILGWTQLLATGQMEESEVEKALATIENCTRTQERLVNDLLDASRIVTGKLVLELQPVDLTSLVTMAVENVRFSAHTKGVSLDLTIAPDMEKIVGDHLRLEQAVTNLLTNAVKFTPAGGRVTLNLFKLDMQAIIKVSDTGIGINPDFLPHTFERFQQEGRLPIKKKEGLGLGLAIARHIVELHGGTITVESAGAGKGATFTIKLPVATC